ncbi:Cofilin [Ophiocordyceps camponoti-floridani]|uniref:Cofilin n=1 Tax=Ophiocordyceps camponoti-floridani TaxID=2030778 RepID=A0A8H4Q1R8_9HYPO|nr:Cofilin [Ophiocordyceps camponoti-floridani]
MMSCFSPQVTVPASCHPAKPSLSPVAVDSEHPPRHFDSSDHVSSPPVSAAASAAAASAADHTDDKSCLNPELPCPRTFREKLINATCKTKSGTVCKGPRYAVYDFEYSLAAGDGVRNKITFIAWSPDDAGVQPKMIYASSKEALKRALTGIATELQANDQDDIEYDSIIKVVSKGLAG